MSEVKDRVPGAFVPGRGYSQADWDDVSDNPEWTNEELAQARPMSEALPELHAALMREIRRKEEGVEAVSLDLDHATAAKLRAIGPDWQERAAEALRRLVEAA